MGQISSACQSYPRFGAQRWIRNEPNDHLIKPGGFGDGPAGLVQFRICREPFDADRLPEATAVVAQR